MNYLQIFIYKFIHLSIHLSINEVCSNAFPELKNIKLENAKNLLIGHLNVNLLRNKYICIKEKQSSRGTL